jgi:ankyrin repeat protein
VTTHHQKREILRLARSGHTRRLQPLLESEVDINFLHRKTGMTPLMTAAHAGCIAVVELQLRYNADPNLRADDNASALHWASRNGNLEVVNMLVAAGADLNARRQTERDGDGAAPIHMALGESHDDVAIALVEAGASVDIEYIGRTVLQYAEWCECVSVVDYLRQSGVRR